MPGIFQTTAGGLWAEHPADARLDYTLEWEALAGDPILTSTWAATPATSPPLAITGQAVDGHSTVAFLSGGVPGTWYAVRNTVTTQSGRTDSKTFMLLVATAIPAAASSALYPFPPAAIAAVRRNRLVALSRTHLAGADIPDDLIWSKITAAEAEAEREMRVWLSPTEVLPAHERYDADADALIALGQRVERDPGYHFTPDMFRGDRWGLIELRARPIIRVHWARFAYPLPDSTVIELPRDWIRPEGYTSRINIVPTTTPFAAPINSFILSALSGGRVVPYMLQLAYRAGLENVRARLPDLPAIVERMASLSLVEDHILPQSSSISADGLSQSISFEAQKHREHIAERLHTMRDSLQGVRTIVL